jgi:aspartyl-tRNA(Asn)/glutamyl-tRNA(Gln) amidotransferase subunit A
LCDAGLLPLEGVRRRRAALLRIEVDAALAYGNLPPGYTSLERAGYLDYGARAKAVALAEADRVIELSAARLATVFDNVDAVVSPTPQAACPFGAEVPNRQNGFSLLANFAGCPAISLPMGITSDAMPLGLRLMIAPGRDFRLQALAQACEAAAGWHLRSAPPFGPG